MTSPLNPNAQAFRPRNSGEPRVDPSKTETDPTRLRYRIRQTIFGILSPAGLVSLLPREDLTPPLSPTIVHPILPPDPTIVWAKRSWDAAATQWRRDLHELDRYIPQLTPGAFPKTTKDLIEETLIPCLNRAQGTVEYSSLEDLLTNTQKKHEPTTLPTEKKENKNIPHTITIEEYIKFLNDFIGEEKAWKRILSLSEEARMNAAPDWAMTIKKA